MDKSTLWKLSAVLSVIGILLAVYLLVQYYQVAPGSESICNLNPLVNCSAMTTGSLATLFGIPVAAVGLVGYAFILISSLTKRKGLMLGMSAFGVLFCLRITILELFFVKIICPVCILCQVIMFILFGISLYLYFTKGKKKSNK